MTSRSRPMRTEQEKQTQPLPGEVDPQEAVAKALLFAAIEKSQVKTVMPAPYQGGAVRPGTAK